MTDDELRFRECYAAHVRALLGYAVRRTPSPEDAADTVAETMLIAWRRIADVPPEPETRLWLYGVARRVLANAHRSDRRRERLAARLGQQLTDELAARDPADLIVPTEIATALASLPDVEREVTLLTAAEGLSPAEIAIVLDANPNTVRTHLHRARLKLRTALLDAEGIDATVTSKRVGATGHTEAGRPTPRLVEQSKEPR